MRSATAVSARLAQGAAREPGPVAGQRALAWLAAVEAEVKARPLVYTGPAFAAEHLGTCAELAAYPLWVAHYTSRPAPLPCPWPADAWQLWQYTGTGSIPGIAGRVDLSRAKSVPGLQR